MNKNKEIVNMCSNFFKIINFEYDDKDEITKKIISIYQKYIFSIDINNNEEVEKIKLLDKLINKYIDDYFFRKMLKKDIFEIKISSKNSNIMTSIVNGLIKIYNKYEEGITRNIYVSRWI